MGACCAEMDIWEANMVATAFTPHPAEKAGLNVCMGDEECGRQDGDRFISPTDRDGCDVNAYRMGDKTFYGPGPEFQVNTQQPFKVVTRFHAPEGTLTGIEQFYVQNGQEIHHPKHAALGNTNIDIAVNMNWLDAYMGDDSSAPGALRGPCDLDDGKPDVLREAHPDAGYTVTNIRWGELGSTSGVSDVIV